MDLSAPFRAAAVDALSKCGSVKCGLARIGGIGVARLADEFPRHRFQGRPHAGIDRRARPHAIFPRLAQVFVGLLIVFHFSTIVQIHRIDLM
ncbi:MAG TPA: hypothetical protein VGI22_15045 [Xanthobacteraceae bacterium]